MSSIDLALCSPAIALNYHWQPKNDIFGSDHFLIIISSTKSPQFQQYWKINKADWTIFAQKCEYSLSLSLHESANITSIEQFVASVVSISNDTIPTKTRSKMKRIKKPWFTDECKQFITQRKKALCKPPYILQYRSIPYLPSQSSADADYHGIQIWST